MLKRLAAVITIGLGSFVSIGSVQAAPIALDQWYAFQWSGTAPADAIACTGGCGLLTGSIDAPADSPWTIDGPVVFKVTDAFISTDQFEIFDNLVSVGTTSLFSTGGSCGPSVDDCYADSDFSSGLFNLGAGSHSITITTVAGSSTAGAAYFRAESGSVPAPVPLALMGLGLAALGYQRRKQIKAT